MSLAGRAHRLRFFARGPSRGGVFFVKWTGRTAQPYFVQTVKSLMQQSVNHLAQAGFFLLLNTAASLGEEIAGRLAWQLGLLEPEP